VQRNTGLTHIRDEQDATGDRRVVLEDSERKCAPERRAGVRRVLLKGGDRLASFELFGSVRVAVKMPQWARKSWRLSSSEVQHV